MELGFLFLVRFLIIYYKFYFNLLEYKLMNKVLNSFIAVFFLVGCAAQTQMISFHQTYSSATELSLFEQIPVVLSSVR
jgi:uncharacterized lipoprotein YajG